MTKFLRFLASSQSFMKIKYFDIMRIHSHSEFFMRAQYCREPPQNNISDQLYKLNILFFNLVIQRVLFVSKRPSFGWQSALKKYSYIIQDLSGGTFRISSIFMYGKRRFRANILISTVKQVLENKNNISV